MRKLRGNAVKAFMKWRSSAVSKFAFNAIRDQEQLLIELVRQGASTQIGKDFYFNDISNYREYNEALPVMDYEALQPYFEKTLLGEQNIFWPEKIIWFAKSSGTTSSQSKLVPVSNATLKTAHYRGAFDIMSQFCKIKPETKVFNGKTIIVSGSLQYYPAYPQVHIGDVSAILVHQQPALANLFRAPPKEVALMSDFEEKLSIVAKNYIYENITGLSGVPTWNIVLLKAILEQTKKQNIGEIWPEMELYVHGGVSFQPHREMFERLVPLPNMEYIQTYNASEGFFAFQDRLGADDMLLATCHGIFYEFIPLDQIASERMEVLPLSQVKIGVQYAIVITTNSGLWRYKIGDTVVFTSVEPFRIKVTGRTKFFINAFGEEVVVGNTDLAIETAAQQTGAIVKQYTAGPKYFGTTGTGAHEWIVEFEKQPNDVEEFKVVLDQTLKSLNSDYEAKRYKDLALGMPIIHIVESGFFYQWLKSKGRIGAQIKIPQLSNDRVLIDELLRLL